MQSFVLVLVEGKIESFVDSSELSAILFSKSTPNGYKFASINFETEKMENYHDGKSIKS